MDSVVEKVPDWDNAIFGFNQGTLVVLIGLIALVFAARLVAMIIIPKIFSKLCERSPIAELAINGSARLWESPLVLRFCGDPALLSSKANWRSCQKWWRSGCHRLRKLSC